MRMGDCKTKNTLKLRGLTTHKKKRPSEEKLEHPFAAQLKGGGGASLGEHLCRQDSSPHVGHSQASGRLCEGKSQDRKQCRAKMA